MVTKDQAVSSAERFLKTAAYPDRADSVVMLPDTAIELGYGWTVRFDFQEHIDTGDMATAPFTSVVVVPHDGTPAHFPPTAYPVDRYMDMRATGNWPPRSQTP
ncbi:YrhB domain-containing protein [Streptomyces sp. NPDC057877]|uniref:YrhB domain-containing protein n=1 Tax=Streptomyces sp. NPDC057877 TaxID=3346269 RepID=UPI0036C82B77